MSPALPATAGMKPVCSVARLPRDVNSVESTRSYHSLVLFNERSLVKARVSLLDRRAELSSKSVLPWFVFFF